jgi:hypothetical protein
MASGGYKDGTKRKPRREWVIKRDTHVPLISDDQAEKILIRLEQGGQKSKTRDRGSDFLLSGLLVKANGERWHGCDGRYYRCGKGKRVSKADIENRVIEAVVKDLSSKRRVLEIFEKIKNRLVETGSESVGLLRSKLSRMDLMRADVIKEAADGIAGVNLVQRLELLEKHEEELRNALSAAEVRQKRLAEVRTHGIKRFNDIYAATLSGISSGNRDETKHLLRQIIEKINLEDERFLPFEITYGVPTNLN